MVADFSAALAQIADQLFATIQLRAGWLVAIKVAYQTNSQRDVVEIIAVHVAAIDLSTPAISNFDLSIAGGGAVPDDKMISEAVLHSSKMSVVVIERGGVALSRSAVVDNDVLPTATSDRRAINLAAHRSGQIPIASATAAASAAAE